MDLKEQLVIWKRSGYLLDHLTLNQPLQEKLVDMGVFTSSMMTKIMVSLKTLKKS